MYDCNASFVPNTYQTKMRGMNLLNHKSYLENTNGGFREKEKGDKILHTERCVTYLKKWAIFSEKREKMK